VQHCLVGSEMCIRDSSTVAKTKPMTSAMRKPRLLTIVKPDTFPYLSPKLETLKVYASGVI
jgi:hypothetical protein